MLLIQGVSIYSKGKEFPEKLLALDAELQESEKHLTMTSSQHEEILQFVEKQQSSQRAVDTLHFVN